MDSNPKPPDWMIPNSGGSNTQSQEHFNQTLDPLDEIYLAGVSGNRPKISDAAFQEFRRYLEEQNKAAKNSDNQSIAPAQ